MLMLLGIAGHYTPQIRTRMAKAAALLGSYDEAVTMLAEEGISISVNQLRTVTAGMGQLLRRMTDLGSMTATGTVSGRRIVVSMDGGVSVCGSDVEAKRRRGAGILTEMA
ncbi:hypothetical protein [Schlesneria sp. DSM 10557]|uniref:hypothetical protein n=1 Tax=Schlesneria sp. DSM 10557 TaxID=3044399 RepID=UPI0035A14524